MAGAETSQGGEREEVGSDRSARDGSYKARRATGVGFSGVERRRWGKGNLLFNLSAMGHQSAELGETRSSLSFKEIIPAAW